MDMNNKEYLDDLVKKLTGNADIVKKHLGLDVICENKKWNYRYALVGLIDCMPIAAIDHVYTLALRGHPESKKYSLVITHLVHGESMIICENISSLVPIWVVTKLVSNLFSVWESWLMKSSSEWRELESLHRHLGGKDNLEGLKSFLQKETFKTALCRDLEGEIYRHVLPNAFLEAAPYSKRGLFQKITADIGKTGWSEDFYKLKKSNWNRPLNLLAGVMGFPEIKPTREEILLKAIKIPTSHDSQWTDLNGVNEYAGLASKKYGAPFLIAKSYFQQFGKSNQTPWNSATLHLYAQAEKYNGKKHFELCDRLQKNQRYQEAWDAALIFAYWRYHTQQKIEAEVQLLFYKMAKEFFYDNLYPIVKRNLPPIE